MEDIAKAEEEISPVRSTWLRRRKGEFLPAETDPNFVVRPGRVVAEMNFGFWTKLLATTYEFRLWRLLHPLFPAALERATLHERLMEIKTLRNRIAHHETLIKRDVQRDYNDLIETIGWISPTTKRWIESENRFPAAYAKPLRKKTKAVAGPAPPEAPLEVGS